MKKTKKQHYIPQFYLKHFSDDKFNIYTIVKPTLKYYNGSIEDTAEKNYFYDLKIMESYDSLSSDQKQLLDNICMKHQGKKYEELEEAEKIHIDQYIESFFSTQIETPFSNMLQLVIKNTYNFNRWVVKNCYFISDDNKKDMAYYLSIQFIRSDSYRNFIAKSKINMYKKTLPIMMQFYGKKISENDINVSIDKENMKMDHIKSILDDELISEIAKIFYLHKWVLYENHTNIPFITSDDSFIIIPTKKFFGIYSGTGLASPGVIIEFPLTTNLLLVMFESTSFQYIIDRHIEIINDTNKIKDANAAIIQNAYRYIYASNLNSVKMVEKLCELHPKIKEINNKQLISM
ncbi:MAG: DUF4238 domain-containing protein [Anaeroplasmataceae bacterium]|nr:DUF4238 domain-containing protein [Anaeroplasmataceae bacterium]